MPHAPSDVSVSDSAAPNLAVLQIRALPNLTLGITGMHIRPHYNPIQTLNVYQNVIIEPLCAQRCLSAKSDTGHDAEMFLYTYPAQLSPFNVL